MTGCGDKNSILTASRRLLWKAVSSQMASSSWVKFNMGLSNPPKNDFEIKLIVLLLFKSWLLKLD